MHLDDEQVQRLLHGELGAVESSVRDHLDRCPECRSRLAEAEGEEAWVLDRLRRLDHGQPRVSLEKVLAANPRRAPAWGRLAAGIFLGLAAAGVAYAAPGSPLPRVIDQIINLLRPAPPTQVVPAPPLSPGESRAGIAVAPGNRLTIVLLEDHAEDTAIVSLTDSAEVIVRAVGGSTTFTSGTERLAIVHQGGPATFEILIPRAAPLVQVEVEGRRILVKESSRVTADVGPDSKGRYVIPLSDSAP
jgi:hypothetical protein